MDRLPGPATPAPRRTGYEDGRPRRRGFPAALALLALLPSACVAIGPTANVAPGPGKSPESFALDSRGCMADVDRRLQPVADRINTLATTPSTNAASNQRLQMEYDRGFNDCMAARGNVPDPAIVRSAAFPPSATSSGPAASGSAEATLPDGWRLLRLSYHGGKGNVRDANDGLWSREIANPPGGPGQSLAVYTMSFRGGDGTVLLSIAGQGEPACDNGPNDVLATRDYAICPAKLAFIQTGRPAAIRSVGRACAEAINVGGVRPGTPDWKDPRLWGTRGRYDAASGTIELATMQDGHPEPACARRLRVR